MSDLTSLVRILAKAQNVPQSSWSLIPPDDGAETVLVFGCPDGNGSYLQALFDGKGTLVRADIVDGKGDVCGCKWCSPRKRVRK